MWQRCELGDNLVENGSFEEGLLLPGVQFYSDSLVPGWNLPSYDPFEEMIQFGGHFYRLLPAGLTWKAAQTQANLMGGNLATIGSQAEQDFVVDTFGPFADRMWIGMTDRRRESDFRWVNGESVKYTNWMRGQPNNYQGQDYVEINVVWGRGKWNDMANAFNGLDAICGLVEIDPRVAAHNGHYYLLGTAGLSWQEAQTEAAAIGGNLVTINDAEEQAFLVDRYGNDQQRLWIGLTDVNDEGTFEWISGESVSFTAWHEGEPNDHGGGEDFTELNFSWFSGAWNDVDEQLSSRWNPRGIIEINPQDLGP